MTSRCLTLVQDHMSNQPKFKSVEFLSGLLFDTNIVFRKADWG